MRVTYIGNGNREVSTDDLIRSGLDLSGLNLDDGPITFMWQSGATNPDIPDVVAEYLLETHRDQFKSGDVINRDLRSRDELYHLAQQLQIPGRSDMSKDDLAEAVDAALAAKANDSEGSETPEDLLDKLDADGV